MNVSVYLKGSLLPPAPPGSGELDTILGGLGFIFVNAWIKIQCFLKDFWWSNFFFICFLGVEI